jgi:hypothetical protein
MSFARSGNCIIAFEGAGERWEDEWTMKLQEPVKDGRMDETMELQEPMKKGRMNETMHFKTILRFTPKSSIGYIAFGQGDQSIKTGPKQPNSAVMH